MTRSKKYLPLTVIFGISIALTGCIVTPNNSNNSNNSNNPNNPNNPNTPYSSPSNSYKNQNSISQQAQSACFGRFGNDSPQIAKVSPLKPGWFEVIIRGYSGRQVACTVDQGGVIADWVEM